MLRNWKILAAVLLAVCSGVQADVLLRMDAAEVGVDLVRFDGFAAVRLTVDNTLGETDLENVFFEMEYTGGLIGLGGWRGDSPDNPWIDAPDKHPNNQYVDGIMHSFGTVSYTASGLWGPILYIGNDIDSTTILEGVVPAGMAWDVYLKLFGLYTDPIVFFHSPAQGVLDINGDVIVLTDSDRSPQTAVPEPATLFILTAGAFALWRKRVRYG